MKKNPMPFLYYIIIEWLKKIPKSMQLTTVLLLFGILGAYAGNSYSQNARVTLNETNVLLEEVLTKIESQTDYLFFYNNRVDVNHLVTIKATNTPVSEVLPSVLQNFDIVYTMEGSHIILKNKELGDFLSENSQEKQRINGLVNDEFGFPIIGANVIIKGTSIGVVTDLEGNFSIEASPGDILVFSYIGYISREIEVGEIGEVDMLNVVLFESLLSLDEIVVVGYGVQVRASVTGSVASIKGDEVVKNRTPDVVNSITGLLPGVIINTRTGEPGREDPDIFIRGRSTTGSTNPLIIIDGIERADLNRINPNDIENISVLKDASAAIYGSRAANGVILITTKRGQKGVPVFNFSYNQGFAQPTRNPIMVDAYTFAQVTNEIETGENRNPVYSDEELEKFRIGTEPGFTTTDWFKTMTREYTPQHQVNLSVSGGTEALDYYLSLGKIGQDGHFNHGTTRLDRYNFRSNLTVSATKNIQVGLDVAGRIDDRHYPGNPDTRGIYSHIYLYRPDWTLYWPGTDYLRPNRSSQSIANWVSDAAGYQDQLYRAMESRLHYKIDIPWVNGLSLSGSANYDVGYQFTKYFNTPSYVYYYDAAADSYDRGRAGEGPELSQLNDRYDQNKAITLNSQINYNTIFKEKHRFGIMAGYERFEYDDNFLEAGRTDFLSPALPYLFAGSSDKSKQSNNGGANLNRRENYFGRATYDYGGRYLGEFIFRYDGSPNFPKDTRWGFFPGFSLGWRISEEAFMSGFTFLNNLKIRGSYGEMGNDAIPPYQYLASYNYGDNVYVIGGTDGVGLLQSTVPNPNITWEIAKSSNIGLEISLWDGLLGMEFDVFKTERSNILTKRTVIVPDYTGLELPDENIGIVENRGFDLQLIHRNSVFANFYYSFTGNLSFARNKIIFADEAPAAEDYQMATGRPIGSELFYDAIGIFRDEEHLEELPHMSGARPGDLIYRDVNGDGEIDTRDMIRVDQTATPEVIFSLNGFIRYKNIDFSILFQGQENVKIYVREQNVDEGVTPQPYFAVMSYNLGNFLEWRAEDRWTPDNHDATMPRGSFENFNNNTQPSTHWLLDGGFLRLKNVEIGYTIPTSVTNRVGLNHVRAYLSANNLFILYDSMKDLGFDPETVDFWYYPQQRIYNFGVNITF